MSESETGFNQMDDIVNNLSAGSQQLRTMFTQLRVEYEGIKDTAVNQVRIQAELEKREALIQQKNEILSILRRALTEEQDIVFQQILTQLQLDASNTKNCANCGQEAFLECTACQRAFYCSTYCQQRDWPLHQHQCTMTQNSESMLASSHLQTNVDHNSHDLSQN